MSENGNLAAITDDYTEELLNDLLSGKEDEAYAPAELRTETRAMYATALEGELTAPIIAFFTRLRQIRQALGLSARALGFTRAELSGLAVEHSSLDEHGVTVGGRLGRAIPIVAAANERVRDYMSRKDIEAPSGLQLWDTISENAARIRKELGIGEGDWTSFTGQLKHAIGSIDVLAKIIDLPEAAVQDVGRVTRNYRMRLTPYYASLIVRGRLDDPILLQSVPTGEMVDNAGIEIPPVAADHSPARMIDQFYPRVVSVKATNICAMYCTHCLRIAHIGKRDRVYSREAYREALDYIREDKLIRDVLVTGGDAFILPNRTLEWLLAELDTIDHVTVKRLGTRIPVTCPFRIDDELLDILAKSNDIKPVRVVTQINTAQEITPLSQDAFRRISRSVCAVLNQAVLLKGINDSCVKMWKLCETIHEAYVRPYYVFNCSYRNPQFEHLRVPIEVGRDLIESMYGNISGDAIPRFIATAGGKVPLHRDNVRVQSPGNVVLRKPWSGEEVKYPDANLERYAERDYAFMRYKKEEE